MAISDRLKALVDQMPDPDGRGMFTKNIDKDKIEKAVAAIFEGGPSNLQGLIEMLGEPGRPENAKPHYALHCVLNHALIVKDEKARSALCQTLAANLRRDLSTYNKAYLCQELQWAGRREAVAALGELLTDEKLCDPAAMALVAISDGAAEQLRNALPRAQGRCLLAIIQALGAVRDAQSIHALVAAVNNRDREIRLAAIWALANIGDPRCANLLLEATDRARGWERIKATKACLVLAEKLLSAGNKREAAGIHKHLRDTRTDPSEDYVRDVATRAIAAAASRGSRL